MFSDLWRVFILGTRQAAHAVVIILAYSCCRSFSNEVNKNLFSRRVGISYVCTTMANARVKLFAAAGKHIYSEKALLAFHLYCDLILVNYSQLFFVVFAQQSVPTYSLVTIIYAVIHTDSACVLPVLHE